MGINPKDQESFNTEVWKEALNLMQDQSSSQDFSFSYFSPAKSPAKKKRNKKQRKKENIIKQ